MEKENKKEFDFIVVKYDKDNYKYIEQIYRLYRDQQRRVFDLACNIRDEDDVANAVEYMLTKPNCITIVAIDKDNGNVAAVFMIDDIAIYTDTIVRNSCHMIICRKYWGPTSRQLLNQMIDKLDNEFIKKINRYEAHIPSNNFGLIKLLKDCGFKCEGTLKDRLLYLDKNNKPKLYDELIFTKKGKI